MNIVKILMNRDGNTEREAQERIDYCRERIYEEAIDTGDLDIVEDIILEELGLEPDFIDQLI